MLYWWAEGVCQIEMVFMAGVKQIHRNFPFLFKSKNSFAEVDLINMKFRMEK